MTTPRTYIVTGAGGGIGGALARRLLADDANVVAVDRSQRRLDALQVAAVDLDGELLAVNVDVTSEEGTEEAVARALDRFGDLHGVANVAGGITGISEHTLDTPLAEITLETFRETMSLNLESAFLMAKAAEAHFESKAYGKLVNVTSLAAYANHPEMGNVPYNAAKAGVISLTRTLALLVGPKGIRVNAVAPGMVLSDRLVASVGQDYVDRHLALTPMGSLASVDDVAGALAFFLDPASDQITGEVLRVAAGVR